MEKEPSTNFYGVFNHFSQTYDGTKVSMVKMCLDVSDVVHANKHT